MKIFNTRANKLVVFALVFAAIGGAYMAYSSFAANSNLPGVRYLTYKNASSVGTATKPPIACPQVIGVPCAVPDFGNVSPTKTNFAPTVNDTVPNIGVVPVTVVKAGSPVVYNNYLARTQQLYVKGDVGQRNSILLNKTTGDCYILRNPGYRAVNVQLVSGSNLVTQEIQPGSDYHRVCVDYKSKGNMLGYSVLVTGSSSPVCLPPDQPTGLKSAIPCPSKTPIIPGIYVYADEQQYSTLAPVRDSGGGSGGDNNNDGSGAGSSPEPSPSGASNSDSVGRVGSN